MPLTPGTRLGRYEVLSPLGAGGMGEVYRARDTRLNRTVALKVANEEFSHRFEREARAIAALSHPNICALFDVGPNFLVMEMLEGETLAARLRRGPLPLPELAKIGGEIAGALERAHRAGVVHRDLKPANVMLTKAGAKLLDFGLAKAEAEVDGEAATQVGTMLGTPAYMSPEQLEGRAADARSDIYALGCVLYEMAAGEPVSLGMKPVQPAALGRLIHACIARDPDERLQSAHDVGWRLAELAAEPEAVAHPRAWLPWAVAAVLAIALAAVFLLRRPSHPPPLAMNVGLNLPDGFQLLDRPLALSPDGANLVVAGTLGAKSQQLWLRRLGQPGLQPIPFTAGATDPFWSPDGRAIGFFANGKLNTVGLDGAPPITLADAPQGRGGTWSSSGQILFSPKVLGGLEEVAAAGGALHAVTHGGASDVSDRLPDFLPDGRHALFLRAATQADGLGGYIELLDTTTGAVRPLMASESGGTYVAPGYLVYYRGGDLLAQPFDARRLRLYGTAAPIATHAVFNPLRFTAMYSFSANGVALVATGAEGARQSELAWFDLDGHKLGTVGTAAAYDGLPAVSPDGKTAAVGVQDADNGTESLWLVNLSTGNRSPFAGPWHYSAHPQPAWSPDGRQIAYSSGDTTGGFVKPTDGSAPAREVVPSLLAHFSWAHAGAGLLLDIEGADGFHEELMPLRPAARIEPLAGLPSQAMVLGLSPDGHWLAYMARSANLTANGGLFVTPYPGPGGHWQLAAAPASSGGWLPDGKHMLYVNPGGKLVEVDVSAQGSQFDVGQQRTIFGGLTLPIAAGATGGSITLALSPDGKRLLLPVPVPGTGADSGAAADGGIRLITDWTRLLPKP